MENGRLNGRFAPGNPGGPGRPRRSDKLAAEAVAAAERLAVACEAFRWGTIGRRELGRVAAEARQVLARIDEHLEAAGHA